MLSTEVHNISKGKWHVYDNVRVGGGGDYCWTIAEATEKTRLPR